MSRQGQKGGPPFIKLIRSEKAIQLLRDVPCFMLLSAIAMRARRTDAFNVHGLETGEALVGDHRSYGLTEQQYRTAKKKLARWVIATFRATNKGTVAKLADSSVYDINSEPDNTEANEQSTSKQRASNERLTTNKNERMEEGKNGSSGIPPAHDLNNSMRGRFCDVIETWNAWHPDRAVDPGADHADARVAYAKLTDVTQFPGRRATVGLLHTNVLLSIVNLAKARDVSSSQAGQWGLKGFLERGHSKYAPGVFSEDDCDQTFNAARYKGDRQLTPTG